MHYANTYLERPVVGDLENVAQEGTTKVLKCMLNTGSDIYQGACKKRGSTLKEEYKNASGTCYMDPRDMVKLGVKNWDTVLVKTDYGEVVLNAAKSRDAPHEGTIFVCKGLELSTAIYQVSFFRKDYVRTHLTQDNLDIRILFPIANHRTARFHDSCFCTCNLLERISQNSHVIIRDRCEHRNLW